jgi:hypothetical protein
MMHLRWKETSLGFKILVVEYLCFGSLGFTFWAMCLDTNGKNLHVNMEILCTMQKNLYHVFKNFIHLLFSYLYVSIEVLMHCPFYLLIIRQFLLLWCKMLSLQVCHLSLISVVDNLATNSGSNIWFTKVTCFSLYIFGICLFFCHFDAWCCIASLSFFIEKCKCWLTCQ